MGIYHSLMYKLSNEESTYNTDVMYSSNNVCYLLKIAHKSCNIDAKGCLSVFSVYTQYAIY